MKIERSVQNDARLHLNAYVDGELPVAKRQAIERLLVANAALRAPLVELAEVRALVQGAYEAVMTS